jgi:hypothetical protein
MNHGFPIIPDILVILFVLAIAVKITNRPAKQKESLVTLKLKKVLRSSPTVYVDQHGHVYKKRANGMFYLESP